MSRSYPIWVSTHNNAYSNNGAKSQGIRDTAQSYICWNVCKQFILVCDFEINHTDNGKKENIFLCYGHLIKTATYQKNKKNMLFKTLTLKVT